MGGATDLRTRLSEAKSSSVSGSDNTSLADLNIFFGSLFPLCLFNLFSFFLLFFDGECTDDSESRF